MTRYEDIQLLLIESQSGIERFKDLYAQAKTNDSHKEVLRVLVKSTLEQLRSSLDYTALDIYESYSKKKANSYIPYKDNEIDFKKSFKSNLNGLEQHRPDLYALVEAAQSYVCGDSWLEDLCSITNKNKHDKLSRQTRKNSANRTISIGNGALVMQGGFSCDNQFINCNFGGVPVNGRISNQMSTDELSKALGGRDNFHKEYERVEFVFEGSDQDVLALVTKSHLKVTEFVESIKAVL